MADETQLPATFGQLQAYVAAALAVITEWVRRYFVLKEHRRRLDELRDQVKTAEEKVAAIDAQLSGHREVMTEMRSSLSSLQQSTERLTRVLERSQETVTKSLTQLATEVAEVKGELKARKRD